MTVATVNTNPWQQAPLKGLVLMYHRVTEVSQDPWSLCVTPRHFEEQLEVLRRMTHPISLERMMQEPLGDLISVAVTFDDGYADNLLNAKPLLERYQIPATVFITTGQIESGREFWWDELERIMLEPSPRPDALCLSIQGVSYKWQFTEPSSSHGDAVDRNQWKPGAPPPTERHAAYLSIWERLRPLPENERHALLDLLFEWAMVPRMARASHRILTIPEVRALGRGEFVSIGAHSVTHPLLSEHSIADQEEEILTSKRALEAIINRPVSTFAYPYGDHNNATLSIVKAAGFTCACSTRPSPVRRDSDRFSVPRFAVGDWSGAEFAHQLEQWGVI